MDSIAKETPREKAHQILMSTETSFMKCKNTFETDIINSCVILMNKLHIPKNEAKILVMEVVSTVIDFRMKGDNTNAKEN